MLSHYSYALFAARILLPLVFIVAAITNMFRWQNTLQFMKSKKIPFTGFFLAAATALKIVASVAVMCNFYLPLGALALILFVLVCNLVFNNFWAVPSPQKFNVLINFFVNLSIIGGFILLIAVYSQ